MKRILLNSKLFLVMVSLLVGLNLYAQTTYTVQNTNDSGSGSLREAINGAIDGDIIRFKNATVNRLVIE